MKKHIVRSARLRRGRYAEEDGVVRWQPGTLGLRWLERPASPVAFLILSCQVSEMGRDGTCVIYTLYWEDGVTSSYTQESIVHLVEEGEFQMLN
jgi:hypothetical protein